jgi:hypothetical protein
VDDHHFDYNTKLTPTPKKLCSPADLLEEKKIFKKIKINPGVCLIIVA